MKYKQIFFVYCIIIIFIFGFIQIYNNKKKLQLFLPLNDDNTNYNNSTIIIIQKTLSSLTSSTTSTTTHDNNIISSSSLRNLDLNNGSNNNNSNNNINHTNHEPIGKQISIDNIVVVDNTNIVKTLLKTSKPSKMSPSKNPSIMPSSYLPSKIPSKNPSIIPSYMPSKNPLIIPSYMPSTYKDSIDDTTPSVTVNNNQTKKNYNNINKLLKNNNKFITYKLIKNNIYSNKYCPHYKCKNATKRHLDPILKPLLDFTVSITTNLKILFLGDSVGIMLAQMLEELTTMMTEQQNDLPTPSQQQLFVDSTNDTRRTILQNGFRYKVKDSNNKVIEIREFAGIHVTAPVNGGGLVAGWRITGLMIPSGASDTKFENKRGGKWKGSDITYLLNHTYDIDIGIDELNNNNTNNTNNNDTNNNDDGHNEASDNQTTTTNTNTATNTISKSKRKIDGFDTIIVRIPHGWMDIKDITKEKLIESIHTAAMNFGSNKTVVTTFIIITLPIINNIETHNDLYMTRRANDMIRELSNTYNKNINNNNNISSSSLLSSQQQQQPNESGHHSNNTNTMMMNTTMMNTTMMNTTMIGGVKAILVLDFANLIDDFIQFQGRRLGYNETEIMSDTYIFDKRCPVENGNRSIPLVCNNRNGTVDDYNYISMDGMHWCNEYLNGRIGAGIACLLQCATTKNNTTNTPDDDDYNDDDPEQLNNCARECNERFMTLNSGSLIHDLSLLE